MASRAVRAEATRPARAGREAGLWPTSFLCLFVAVFFLRPVAAMRSVSGLGYGRKAES
jgi:hypothetical protein